MAAGNGSALAVWHQSNGTRSDIWSNRYVAGSGWGKPELIESNDTGTARFPQVAANTDGNALAVWPQESARGKIDIWANRYVPGIGWGTAELVETRNAGSANLPQLSLNNNGTAVTVWLQSDGSHDSVWANHWLAR